MSALLRLGPQALPISIVWRKPVSDEEFAALCQNNDLFQFERTREGETRMNPPAGGFTGDGNRSITQQSANWWESHLQGRTFDSSTGFRLPDTSTLSPDASYVSQQQLAKLKKADLRGFPPVCPSFIIELLSESDLLADTQDKMLRWIENGALLGWLIDPYRQQVWVYQPEQAVVTVSGLEIRGSGPVEGFTLDLNKVWRCYEF